MSTPISVSFMAILTISIASVSSIARCLIFGTIEIWGQTFVHKGLYYAWYDL